MTRTTIDKKVSRIIPMLLTISINITPPRVGRQISRSKTVRLRCRTSDGFSFSQLWCSQASTASSALARTSGTESSPPFISRFSQEFQLYIQHFIFLILDASMIVSLKNCYKSMGVHTQIILYTTFCFLIYDLVRNHKWRNKGCPNQGCGSEANQGAGKGSQLHKTD